jgi:hypothetical protein
MHLTPDGQSTEPPTDPLATWIATMRGSLPHVTTNQVMSLTRDDATTLHSMFKFLSDSAMNETRRGF